MLETIAVILLLMWLLGMVTAYTVGGFIHILLVIAIIVILVRVIQGRRPIERDTWLGSFYRLCFYERSRNEELILVGN
jgi:hypothetical protein